MAKAISWFPKEGAYVASSNFYGYYNAITKTRAACQKLGLTFSAKSNVHFTYCAPHSFEYFPGKFNVLYSMYETPDAPSEVVEKVSRADLIIVPSKFCQTYFKQWSGKPVLVSPLGTDHVPYLERKVTTKVEDKFRFLWTGAFNARKGWWNMGVVWEHFFEKFPFLELYIKTTTENPSMQKIFTRGNTITDARNISREEMIQLYHSAHCFVLPTMGEGWGLTVAEAMSSGCPTITTEYSGMLEFANRRNCYFAPHSLKRIEASMGGPSCRHEDGLYQFAITDLVGLAQTMAHVMDGYENALKVGKRAHKDMQAFTWERAGQGILDIVRDL